MHCRPAILPRLQVDCIANFRISARQVRNPFSECAEVHHRAADQQRYAARRKNLHHCDAGIAHKVASRIAVLGIANIDESMWRALQRLAVWFGGTDVHAAIHQRGIDADDVARKSLAEADRDVGFARCRRTHQEYRFANHWRSQRPRRKRRSSSDIVTVVQVGRP